MSKSLSPAKRTYKQSSILSYVSDQQKLVKKSSKEVDKESATSVCQEAKVKATSSSGNKESQSQDSDIICLGEVTAGTSGLTATNRISPIAGTSGVVDTESSQDSLDIADNMQASNESPRVDNSQDLFDSESDDALLAAAAAADSPTQAYSQSQDSQVDSQASDLGFPFQRMRLFPSADQLHRRVKKSCDTHSVFVRTPTIRDQVPESSSKFYQDVWSEMHVRMPCSKSNIYPDRDRPGKTKPRWELIEAALLVDMKSSEDIEKAILTYNYRYEGKWRFTLLHDTINHHMTAAERIDLFNETLPSMVRLALSLPSLVTEGVPLLRKQMKYSLTFSQQQLASILANAFFCTFPRRNAAHKNSEYATYPSINMNGMFAVSGRNKNRDLSMVHKLKCLFHYFSSVTKKMPSGCVTFKRKVVDGLSSADWSASTKTFTDCFFTSRGLIEEAHNAVQVDFANRMVGGGVLRTGCVQEEIQFVIHPELIVSRLFTEQLDSNEVLVIKGAQCFSDYTGYADTFRFAGGHTDNIALDDLGRRYRHIIAMDATRFTRPQAQYTQDSVIREMNKAYCAFHSNKRDNSVAVATGNWGCGAFKGNHYFKGLLQLMVAAECNRQLYYSVFGDTRLQQGLHDFYDFCVTEGITVGNLWPLIADYNNFIKDQKSPPDILQFIVNKLS